MKMPSIMDNSSSLLLLLIVENKQKQVKSPGKKAQRGIWNTLDKDEKVSHHIQLHHQ
jgi:hypothetical protein